MTNLFDETSFTEPVVHPIVTPIADSQTANDVSSSDAIDRVDAVLDKLEQLSELLTLDESFEVAPLNYQLPDDFKLSVVIPAYNEQKTIHGILARVSALPLPMEIIVVDDCSSDGTRELLQPLEAAANLRIVYKYKNAGKGAALRTGFEQATGDIVIVQDADMEYDPRDIPDVIRPIVEGDADVVYGSRYLANDGQDHSFLHRLGNGLLTKTSNLLTGLRLTDMETCYKAFRRNVLRGVTIKQDRFGFEPEITAKIARRRYRIREVPIRYDARGYHEGKKIGVKDGLNALYCIVRYGLSD